MKRKILLVTIAAGLLARGCRPGPPRPSARSAARWAAATPAPASCPSSAGRWTTTASTRSTSWSTASIAGRATYGRSRPGVTAKLPGLPGLGAPPASPSSSTPPTTSTACTRSACGSRSKTGEVVDLQRRAVPVPQRHAHPRPLRHDRVPQRRTPSCAATATWPTRRAASASSPATRSTPACRRTTHGVGYVELLIDGAAVRQQQDRLLLLDRHRRPVELLRPAPAGHRAASSPASRTARTAASASCSTSAS